MPDFGSMQFWVAVLQIIAIDIVLSGDNAVVIALACRNLPPEQRRKGVFWGVFGAVGLRVVLTVFTAQVLGIQYLKVVGALLLVWIGVKLMLPENEDGHEIKAADNLWSAVRTIIIADFVMSLDNVIAVAGAAKDSILLLIFGLAVSIPLIVWSSQLIMKWMERFPVIVTLGAGLLGWVAGGMVVSDPALKGYFAANPNLAHYVAAAIGALLVVGTGWLIARNMAAQREYEVTAGSPREVTHKSE